MADPSTEHRLGGLDAMAFIDALTVRYQDTALQNLKSENPEVINKLLGR